MEKAADKGTQGGGEALRGARACLDARARGRACARDGRLPAVAGALAGAAVLLAVLVAQFGAPSFALREGVPPDSHTWSMAVLMACTAVGCAAWGVWARHRCPDAYVGRCVAGAAALLVAWVLLVFVKWSVHSTAVATAMWYLYYVPMLLVPTLGLFAVARAAAVDGAPAARAVKRAVLAVDVALAAFVLTNNLHGQVFSLDPSDPVWDGDYAYAWGYAAVLAWIVLKVVLLVALAHVASCRRLHSAVATLGVLLAVLGAYIVLYILDVWLFRANLAVTCSVMTVAAFETCFDLGILPSYRRWDEMFARLPFDLRVLGPDLGQACATDCAGPLDPAVRARLAQMLRQGEDRGRFEVPGIAHRQFKAFPVEGGTALLSEDVSSIDARRADLERARAQLRARNALLEQDREVQAALCRQRTERALCDGVERVLERSMRRMGELLAELDGTGLDEDARRARLSELRLLLAYSKRRGALALTDAGHGADGRAAAGAVPGARLPLELDADRLGLMAEEACADLRAAGFDCCVACDLRAPVPLEEASLLYDCLFDCAFAAAGRREPVLMAHLSSREGGPFGLRVAVEAGDGADLAAGLRGGAVRALECGARTVPGGCSCAVEASPGELHVSVALGGAPADGGGAR